jgi:hypothetical protein
MAPTDESVAAYSDLDHAHTSVDRHQLAIVEPSRGIARPDYRRYPVLAGDL